MIRMECNKSAAVQYGLQDKLMPVDACIYEVSKEPQLLHLPSVVLPSNWNFAVYTKSSFLLGM